MSKVPSLSYDKIIRALQRDGWVIVRTKGNHFRLQKHVVNETLEADNSCSSAGQKIYTCPYPETGTPDRR